MHALLWTLVVSLALATTAHAATIYRWSCGTTPSFLSCESVSTTTCEYKDRDSCSAVTRIPSPICLALSGDHLIGVIVETSFCNGTPVPKPICTHPLCNNPHRGSTIDANDDASVGLYKWHCFLPSDSDLSNPVSCDEEAAFCSGESCSQTSFRTVKCLNASLLEASDNLCESPDTPKPDVSVQCTPAAGCNLWLCLEPSLDTNGEEQFTECAERHWSACPCESNLSEINSRTRTVVCSEYQQNTTSPLIVDESHCNVRGRPSASELCPAPVGGNCTNGNGTEPERYAWQCYAANDAAHTAPTNCTSFAPFCEDTCGGVHITRLVACKMIDSLGEPLAVGSADDAYCAPSSGPNGEPTGSTKPAAEGVCSGWDGDGCEYSWRCLDKDSIGADVCNSNHWSDCSCDIPDSSSPEGVTGTRSRSIACMLKRNSTSLIPVSSNLCGEFTRPSDRMPCEQGACRPQYRWSCYRTIWGGVVASNCLEAVDICKKEGPLCDSVSVPRAVGCVDSGDRIVADSFCSGLPGAPKPDDFVICNATSQCSYFWKCRSNNGVLEECSDSHWSVCKCVKDQLGAKTRSPLCVVKMSDSEDLRITAEENCVHISKPMSSEICNPQGCPMWQYYSDSTFTLRVVRGSASICPVKSCEITSMYSVPRCENHFGAVLRDKDCEDYVGLSPSTEVICPVGSCAPDAEEYLWRCAVLPQHQSANFPGAANASFSACTDYHWTPCEGGCDGKPGHRYRDIFCVHRRGTEFTSADSVNCDILLKPPSLNACSAPACPRWSCYASSDFTTPTGCGRSQSDDDLDEICPSARLPCGSLARGYRYVRCEFNGIAVSDSTCNDISHLVGSKPVEDPMCSFKACNFPTLTWLAHDSPACFLQNLDGDYCAAARTRTVNCYNTSAFFPPQLVSPDRCDPSKRPDDVIPCDTGLVSCTHRQGTCVTAPVVIAGNTTSVEEGVCECREGFYGPRCELSEPYLPTYSWNTDPFPTCYFPDGDHIQYCAAAHQVVVTCLRRVTPESTPQVVKDEYCDPQTRPPAILPCTNGLVPCVAGHGTCATAPAKIGNLQTDVLQGTCACKNGHYGPGCEFTEATEYKYHWTTVKDLSCYFPDMRKTYCQAAQKASVSCRRFTLNGTDAGVVHDMFCNQLSRPPSSYQCTRGLSTCVSNQGFCNTYPSTVNVPANEHPALEGVCECFKGFVGSRCEQRESPTTSYIWEPKFDSCFEPEGEGVYCYSERPSIGQCFTEKDHIPVSAHYCGSQATFTSCEKTIQCINGGECIKNEVRSAPGFIELVTLGKCHCPSGFYGNDCSSSTPIPLQLSNFKVEFAPPYDVMTATWEATGVSADLNSHLRVLISDSARKSTVVLGSVPILTRRFSILGRDLVLLMHNSGAIVSISPLISSAAQKDASLTLPARCLVSGLSCGTYGVCNTDSGRCDCKGDFTGLTCNISPCASKGCNPAFSNCTLTPSFTATCSCPQGSNRDSLFRDDTCRTPIGCETNEICKNGGAPTGKFNNSATECAGCVCVGRWGGVSCTVCDLNSRCGYGQSDAECTSCICSPGYTGKRCECRAVTATLLFSGPYIEWFFTAPEQAHDIWKAQISSSLNAIVKMAGFNAVVVQSLALTDIQKRRHVSVKVHITDRCVSANELAHGRLFAKDGAIPFLANHFSLELPFSNSELANIRTDLVSFSNVHATRLPHLSPSIVLAAEEFSADGASSMSDESSITGLYEALDKIKNSFTSGTLAHSLGLEGLNTTVGLGLSDPLCAPSPVSDGSSVPCPSNIGKGAVIEIYEPTQPKHIAGLKVGIFIVIVIGGAIFLVLLAVFLIALINGLLCFYRCRGCRCCKRQCRCCRTPGPGGTKDDTPPPSPRRGVRQHEVAEPRDFGPVTISNIKFNFV